VVQGRAASQESVATAALYDLPDFENICNGGEAAYRHLAATFSLWRVSTQESGPDDASGDLEGSTSRDKVVLARPWLLAGDKRESIRVPLGNGVE